MSTAPPLLDTNVLLRHLLGDVPEQSRRASALLKRVEAGDLRVRITESVVFETVFTLSRTYKKTPHEIRDAILPILELPTITLPGKAIVREGFRLFAELNLPFADAYHAALMADLGVTEIYSFDPHFDRVPGITRRES
jgi:predicted nucleic acid-binding protein